jgi:hypothetical protein
MAVQEMVPELPMGVVTAILLMPQLLQDLAAKAAPMTDRPSKVADLLVMAAAMAAMCLLTPALLMQPGAEVLVVTAVMAVLVVQLTLPGSRATAAAVVVVVLVGVRMLLELEAAWEY